MISKHASDLHVAPLGEKGVTSIKKQDSYRDSRLSGSPYSSM